MEDQNVKVFVRVRAPLGATEICVQADGNTLKCGETFTFDGVEPSTSTQTEIFETIAKPVADVCLQGINGTILAYGQTGSGKSYTISGPNDDIDGASEHRGLLPRSLDYVFSRIREAEAAGDGKLTYKCKASYLEIYQERVYDLLSPTAATASGSSSAASAAASAAPGGESLQIRGEQSSGVWVDGLTEVPLTTAKEGYEVLARGLKNRRVGATAMNRESSRSHSVFTLEVCAEEKAGKVTKSRTALFRLVDLAGSEKQSSSKAAGERLKEASQINKSLSALGNVIRALTVEEAKGRSAAYAAHIPHRDSKLTWLLSDSLGGNSKTTLIATISPDGRCVNESISTLRFAVRAKMMRNSARVNEESSGNVAELRAEVDKLRARVKEFEGLTMTATAADSLLSAWDTVFKDITNSSATNAATASGKSVAAAVIPTGKAGVSGSDILAAARAEGESKGSGAAASATTTAASTQALTALAQVYKKVLTVTGGSCSSATLAAAAAGYERLAAAESAVAEALALREEGESSLESLQTVLDTTRTEKAAVEAAADSMRVLVGKLEEEFARVKEEAAAAEAKAEAAEKAAAAATAAAAAAAAKSPAKKTTTTGTVGGKIGPGAASAQAAAASKLAQPGFKRRASVTSTGAGAAAAPGSTSSTTSAVSRIPQPALARRTSVTTTTSTGLAAAAAAAVAATSVAAAAAPAPAPAAIPTATLLEQYSALIEAAKAACNACANATAERSLAELRSENTALKARLAALGSAGAGAETVTADAEAAATSGAGTITLSRAGFTAIVREHTALAAELSGMREHVLSRCDPAVLDRLREASVAHHADLHAQKKAFEAQLAREWERVKNAMASSRAMVEVKDEEIAALQAELATAAAVTEEREEALHATSRALQEARARNDMLSSRESRLASELQHMQETSSSDLQQIIARAEASISALEAQLQEARHAAAAAAEDAAQAKANLAAAVGKQREVESVRDKLGAALSAKQTETAALEARAAELEQLLADALSTASTADASIQRDRAALCEAKQRIAALEGEVADANRRAQRAQFDLDSLEEDIASANAAARYQAEARAAAEARCSELEVQLAAAAEAAATSSKTQADVAATRAQLARSEKTVAELQKQVGELQSAVTAAKAATTTAAAQHAAAIDNAEGRIAELEQLLVEAEAAKATVSAAEVEEYQRRIVEAEAAAAAAQASAAEAVAAAQAAAKRAQEEQVAAVEAVEARIRTLKKQATDAEAGAAAAKKELSRQQRLYGDLERSKASLLELVQAAEVDKEELRAQATTAEAAASTAQAQLRASQAELSRLREAAGEQEGTVASHSARLASATAELTAVTARYTALQAVEADLRKQVASLKASVQSASATAAANVDSAVTEAHSRMLAAEESVLQLRSQVSSLHGELEATQAKCATLERQVADKARAVESATAARAAADGGHGAVMQELRAAKTMIATFKKNVADKDASINSLKEKVADLQYQLVVAQQQPQAQARAPATASALMSPLRPSARINAAASSTPRQAAKSAVNTASADAENAPVATIIGKTPLRGTAAAATGSVTASLLALKTVPATPLGVQRQLQNAVLHGVLPAASPYDASKRYTPAKVAWAEQGAGSAVRGFHC